MIIICTCIRKWEDIIIIFLLLSPAAILDKMLIEHAITTLYSFSYSILNICVPDKKLKQELIQWYCMDLIVNAKNIIKGMMTATTKY